jgi:hypothetical protein
VDIRTDTVITKNRYRPEQTKVWSPQKLHHSIRAECTVYIGGISSCECPVGTVSNMDYIRLLLVETCVYR